MAIYARWQHLSQQQKDLVNNGCGPSWLPKQFKQFLKKVVFAWMFHASCGHHDFGYIVGGSERRRLYCDYRFGQAIARDVVTQWKLGKHWYAVMASGIGLFFFLVVFFFGWSSFHYGTPKSRSMVIHAVTPPRKPGTLKSRLRNWRW